VVKISLIVVNYNGGDLTINCLKALARQSLRDFEIILVDNNSSDNSLREIQEFLDKNLFDIPLKIITLQSNLGFAGGNIKALSLSESQYIALLNNDTEPDKDWLGNLMREMETQSDIGICASKMIVHGTNIIDSAGDGYAASLKGFKRGEGETSENYNLKGYVFGACAGAALYRRKMLDEIGFLDEDFFLIHEDTDLNFRAQSAGWKVLYVPSAIVYHKVRSTIGHMSDMAIYYSLRNSEFVRIKNVPFLLFLRTFPEFFLGAIFEFVYFVIRHKKLKLYAQAKIDVLKKLGTMLHKRKEIMSMKKKKDEYLLSIMTPVWAREFFLNKLKKLFSEQPKKP